MIKIIPFEDKEENYVIMQEWCSHEFVYEWFEQRILSLDEIRSKYKTKLEVGEQDLFFINYDGKNIGFAQIYKYKGNYFTKTYEYDLFIDGERKLDIDVTLNDEKAKYTIAGNRDLKDGSVIKITSTSESGEVKEYKINVKKQLVAAPRQNSSGLLFGLIIYVSFNDILRLIGVK